ncbi:hypothetical protein pdam_00003635 [Pocillopora damicornis]|uniref:Uncharacterized protein n=1 Tax=Pocillopora damicornis TaxID=46731 RepID=A0A3M6V172_POCDA|nr:hypothetical protein pdam_00003635 [Pocillopora damicornis]
MKPSIRGRPSGMESRQIIWLTRSILKAWNERKTALGFGKNVSSEFAEALLCNISEESQTETSKTGKRLQSIKILIPCRVSSTQAKSATVNFYTLTEL